MIGLLLASFSVDSVVDFPDPNLELAIREILAHSGKPIHKSQVLNITQLDLSRRDITNLEGLQHFRNLKVLNLANNQVSDLSPLENISALRELNLDNNQITDLQQLNLDLLAKIPLRIINLSNNYSITADGQQLNLMDISLISKFSELEELYLSGGDVTDLTPISDLNKLIVLELRDNEIKDIAPLRHLLNLKELNLRGNNIKDLTPISNLLKLEYLNLHSNKHIRSIEPISYLVKLEKLVLRNVPIGDETDLLLKLPKLQYLNIRACGIKNVEFLQLIVANGALQDDPEKGIFAYLDIRDNPIAHDSMFLPALVPYWDQIQIKYPFLFTVEAPEFSHTSGFYEKPFMLSITSSTPNTSIHYTLDGSMPTRESPVYTEPIIIQSRVGDTNTISMIDTISYRFQEPNGEVFKITTIRACSFDKQSQAISPVITHSYFVDEQIYEHYSLPIVSLVIDPTYLFDAEQGIYVTGKDERTDVDSWEKAFFLSGNYYFTGEDWERPIHFEFFEKNGNLAFSENAGVRIHGGTSRTYGQKSLRLYADSDYLASNLFGHNFFSTFENKKISKFDSYETLIIRNTGSDWENAFIRDALIHQLVSHTKLDTQSYRPVIVFLNGEYWGLYNIRERYDQTYFYNHYGIDPQNLVILEENGQVDIGTYLDVQNYDALIDQILEFDLTQNNAFKEVEKLIDVDNYIDYQIVEYYIANQDWPSNNIKYWRMRTDEVYLEAPYGQDGRWRWLLFDTDNAFNNLESNGLNIRNFGDEKIIPPRLLLVNKEFRNRFINRFADHMNTTFKPERVIHEIDAIASLIAPEMEEQIARWHSSGGSVEAWLANVEDLRNFAQKRPHFMIGYLLDYFDLSGTYQLSLQCDPEKGSVRVNSIDITTNTPGVQDPNNWSGTYFQNIPLTITAMPRQGFAFSHWEGNFQEYNTTATITIDSIADITLKPVFVPEK